jgi:hypothetical protein
MRNSGNTRRFSAHFSITAVLTAVAMMLFFIIMQTLRMNYIVEAHYFNIVIIFAGIYIEIRHEKSVHGEIPYLKGLFAGVMFAGVSSFIFNAFLIIYLSLIDRNFMQYLKDVMPLGHLMTPWTIALVLFVEQTAAGLINSMIVMFAEGKSNRVQNT